MSEKKIISFGKIFWPTFVAVIVASIVGFIFFLLTVFGIIGSLSSETSEEMDDKTVLHLTLEGDISEKSSSKFDPSSFEVKQKVGLSDIIYGFERAEKDAAIKGVFLEIKDAQCGIATAKEIRDAIDKFEKSGKFVIAYLSGEAINQKQYYIASAANQIYGFPTSMMEFVGLGGELTFFKKTLDMLSVEMQVIRGRNNDFKSAVEPFFLEKMSDSSRLQMQVYINNIWSEMRTDIATSRKIKAGDLNKYAENLSIKRLTDAAKYKLIDGTKYKDEVLEMIASKIGVSKNDDISFSPFEKYAKKKFKDNQVLTAAENPNIAVVIAEGDIAVNGDGISSEKLCKTLREVRLNKKIKSLVLRINSPGGSALASDEIWREVELIKKTKKVIVSMGDVAASGGYYIAAPANYIFAESSTITGSIGVFGVIPYTGKMFEDKLGISFDRISTNKHAVLSTNRKLTPEEFLIIQNEVNAIYDDFLKRVSEGRGLSKQQVHQIARGRVWTGSDAVKIGLVDEIGGLEKAIAYAAKSAKIKDAKVLYYPKHKEDPFEEILEMLDEQDKEEGESKVQMTKLPSEFLKQYEQLKRLENFKGIQMRLPYTLELN